MGFLFAQQLTCRKRKKVSKCQPAILAPCSYPYGACTLFKRYPQKLIVALKLKPLIAEKAKEKQVTEGKELGGSPTLPQKSAKGSIDTRQELAKIAGVSHDTIDRVEYITKHATEKPSKTGLTRISWAGGILLGNKH